MKKILIITPDMLPSKGGIEQVIFDLSYNLKKNFNIQIFSGSRITKINKKKKYFFEKTLICKHPTFKLFGLDFPKNFFTYFDLYRKIQNHDIIIINDIKLFFLVAQYLHNY